MAKHTILGLIGTALALTMPLAYADMGNGGGAASGQAPAQMVQSGAPGSGSGHGWKHRRGEGMDLMSKVLDLTDDQKKHLEDLHKKQKDAMKASMEQLRTNRQAFSAEIVKANPDTGRLTQLQTELKAIQSQMADSRFNALLDTKKIMSPEQFSGFMALKKAEMLRKRGHGRFHHGGGEHGAWKGHKGREAAMSGGPQENP